MSNCAACGFEASPDFAFCPRCGQRLPGACTACGRPCEAGFAFCPHCGAPQRAATEPRKPAKPDATDREVDRRRVTVLFADLSGFTTLAERVDPEVVRAFQNRLFETLARTITRYDGFVEKFVGDAVLAVFGAPVAHEDDPERACNAALDMLEQGTALSREWQGRLGQPVQLHVGIHTGPVVAGHLGGAAGAAYAVTGDTVNTTARLLAAAEPGTVLVSAATHALAQHRFAFEPKGELALRGKADPAVVYRLIGTQTERGSGRGLTPLGLGSPFVGHGDELDELRAAFDRMQHGKAQVVSVIGEAGSGKSRLISELMSRLDLADVAVRRVACSSLGEPTYGVFAYRLARRRAREAR
jgi:adenylate cyclase